jgi:hypothetical protein
MPGRRLYVDMSALLEAMDSRAAQPAFVFDTLTGEIALALEPDVAPVSGRESDDSGIVPIPRAAGEPGPVAPQTQEHKDENQGEYLDRRQAHQAQLLEQALAWLHTLGIDPQFELATVRRPRPLGRPGRRPGQPAVGLFDLLLLGGPEPDPEGDVINRRFLAASREQAQAVFVRVARELCEHHGQPWRRDVVEAQSHYEVGRTRLALEGKAVQLEVEVAAGLRALFHPTGRLGEG